MLSVWKSNNTMPQNVILQNGKCFLIHLPTSSTILLQKILGNNTTVKMLLCKMAMLCQASWLLGNLGYTKKKYFEFSICVSFSSVCDASPRVSLCAGLAWQTVSAPSPRTNHLLENWKTTTANMETNEKMVIWNRILEGIHLWETPIMGDNWETLNLGNAHILRNPCTMLGQSRVERILENSLGSSPADNPVPGHLLPIPQKTDLENNCSLFDLSLSICPRFHPHNLSWRECLSRILTGVLTPNSRLLHTNYIVSIMRLMMNLLSTSFIFVALCFFWHIVKTLERHQTSGLSY